MKKFVLLLIAFGSLIYAQESSTDNPVIAQNELSVNLPLSTIIQFPMVSYERLHSADLGYGTSAGFSVGSESIELTFQIVPFVRWYFMNTGNETVYGRRFFIEANASIFGIDEDEDNYGYQDEDDSSFGGGLGLGIGYKYVNNSNWIGTIYLGAGKNFADGNIEVYPHLGINIGKRF